MTDRIRIAIPAYYRASVVPRGARLPRPRAFRTTVPVDIAVARSADLAVAARASSPKLGGTYEYFSHGSRLYVPVRAGWAPGSPPLPAETGLANIAAGLDLHPGSSLPNPFAHVGPRWVMGPDREQARPIDDMVLRSVVRDEREAVTAEIHRLAADFLVDDEGRLLRASPGPHWASFNVWSIEPNPCLYDPPVGQPTMFHSSRKDEAYDHLVRHRSKGSHSAIGTIDVLDGSVLPDRDAVHVVYGLYRRDLFDLVNGANLSRDPGLARLAAPVVAAFEQLWGWPWTIIADPRFRWVVPHGIRTPDAERLAVCVEDLRYLVAEASGRMEGNELDAWRGGPAPLWRESLLRWDAFELPRLLPEDPAPDLEAPPGAVP